MSLIFKILDVFIFIVSFQRDGDVGVLGGGSMIGVWVVVGVLGGMCVCVCVC